MANYPINIAIKVSQLNKRMVNADNMHGYTLRNCRATVTVPTGLGGQASCCGIEQQRI